MTDDVVKKTVEMEEYEEDTGKLAVWRGKISRDFLKWQEQKRKEEKKREKEEILALSREEKKRFKQRASTEESDKSSYDHLIKVENLHKTYLLGTTAVAALRGVDLTIDKGDFVDIMGPSGSGKTTLLNLIGGLDTPTRGKIYLEGRNISMLNDNDLAEMRRENIGFVFQFYNLLPQMTALENVLVPLHFSGKLSRRGKRKRGMDLLRLVGLEERAHHTPSELSGGEQQRVALASILALEPKILVLDEPTGLLDPSVAKKIIILLKKIQEETGITIIISEHRMDLVLPLVDEIILMKEGKVIDYDKKDNILNSKSFNELNISHPIIYTLFKELRNEGIYYGKIPSSITEALQLLQKHVKLQ